MSHNCIFQNFLKNKNIHQYSRFTEKSPTTVEKVMERIRNLKKRPVLEKANADWLTELPIVDKTYNETVHRSIKLIPTQAFEKSNKKEFYSNFQDKRQKKQNPKLGDLIRTSDIRSVFSKGDITKFS